MHLELSTAVGTGLAVRPHVVAGRGEETAGVADVLPALGSYGEGLADHVVPGVEGIAADGGKPHAAANASGAVEDEAGCAGHRGEVDDAASADAVAAEQAHAVADGEIKDSGIGGTEEEVVLEVV